MASIEPPQGTGVPVRLNLNHEGRLMEHTRRWPPACPKRGGTDQGDRAVGSDPLPNAEFRFQTTEFTDCCGGVARMWSVICALRVGVPGHECLPAK